MNQELLKADYLLSLPKTYYPLFDFCHILLCVLTVRKECGKKFAHDHWIATWLSCIVSSFAGSLLANPLLGKPLFGAFSDERLLAMATLIYLAVFFSPGDIVYSLVKMKPIYVLICFLKEIYRAKKIYAGFLDGQKAFPTSPYFVPICVAVLKGNGSAFIAPLSRLIRGDWKPQSTEIMKPSATTKECFLAALIFASIGKQDMVVITLIGLFLSIKLGAVFGNPVDPFTSFEAIVASVLDNISDPGDAETTKKEKTS